MAAKIHVARVFPPDVSTEAHQTGAVPFRTVYLTGKLTSRRPTISHDIPQYPASKLLIVASAAPAVYSRREKFLKRIFRDLPGSIPESDAPWTRRLTGVSRTWLSQNPGPPNLARETITRTPAATLPQARLTSPAPRP